MQIYCTLPFVLVITRLSKFMLDGYLLMEEIQENSFFASYVLTCLLKLFSKSSVQRDQLFICTFVYNAKILHKLALMIKRRFLYLSLQQTSVHIGFWNNRREMNMHLSLKQLLLYNWCQMVSLLNFSIQIFNTQGET